MQQSRVYMKKVRLICAGFPLQGLRGVYKNRPSQVSAVQDKCGSKQDFKLEYIILATFVIHSGNIHFHAPKLLLCLAELLDTSLIHVHTHIRIHTLVNTQCHISFCLAYFIKSAHNKIRHTCIHINGDDVNKRDKVRFDLSGLFKDSPHVLTRRHFNLCVNTNTRHLKV